MTFLKLFLLAMALVLLPGCDTTRSVTGEIVAYHAGEQDNLTGLTIRTDEGETLTLVPSAEDAHLTTFWLGEPTVAEIREKFPGAVMVSARYGGRPTTLTLADGSQTPAYTAEWVMDTAHLETRNVYTFSDGVTADRWESWPGYSYRLADRTELLRVDGPSGPADHYVGGVDGLDALSPAVQEKVLAFYGEQELLYDEKAELERAYGFYLEDPEHFQSLMVGQNVSPCYSNGHIISFMTTTTLPLKPQYITEVRLCHTFDRNTGEQVSNYDLFTIPPEELLAAMLDENWDSPPSIPEMQTALRPEYIHLSRDRLSIHFPAGTLPGQEHSYGFGVSYFGQEWDILQPWAQPNA